MENVLNLYRSLKIRQRQQSLSFIKICNGRSRIDVQKAVGVVLCVVGPVVCVCVCLCACILYFIKTVFAVPALASSCQFDCVVISYFCLCALYHFSFVCVHWNLMPLLGLAS